MSDQPCILIVDDDPVNIDIMEQELREIPCITDSAASGEEALAKITENPPDLILLDVMMPGVNGITVCRQLKDTPETTLIPVIIVTALDDMEVRIRGLKAGADDFLSRPVNNDELRARIGTSLRRKETVENEIAKLRRRLDYLANFAPGIIRRIAETAPESYEFPVAEQELSVLFADITGYTQLSESVSSEDLHKLVQQYFSAFIDCIHKGGGDLTETTGDGCMVVVRGQEVENHASVAVKIAQCLISETERLNALRNELPVSLHVGVSSGRAVAGTVRFRGIQDTRWVYTAYGQTPNLAARLMDKAGPGEILVCPHAASSIREEFNLEDAGQLSLKNIANPVRAHRVGARI